MTQKVEYAMVGTGPSSVSCAVPLLKNGKSVLFLDGGDGSAIKYGRAREQSERRDELGCGLLPISIYEGLSPKLRNTVDPLFIEKYMAHNHIEATNFECVGALAEGGLSGFWGAVSPKFSQQECKMGAIDWLEMENSYRNISERIGISGSNSDPLAPILGEDIPLQPPLPLSPLAAALLQRTSSQSSTATVFGRCRSAVLTQPLDGRSACQLEGDCMSGCEVGAIYNSFAELEQFRKCPNAEIRTNHLVEKIEERGSVVGVSGTNLLTGEQFHILADRVILAAGTLPSTRLALDFMNAGEGEFRLETTPSVSFGIVVPRMLGKEIQREKFGMAQLAFAIPSSCPGVNAAFGTFYDSASFALPDLAAQSFLTYRGGQQIISRLLSSLAVGLVFLPGECSNNQVKVTREGIKRKLHIVGDFSADFEVHLKTVMAKLRRDLFRLGAWVIPGSVSASRPGADAHYGATLPMGRVTNQYGKLPNTDRVFVVDGSVLPCLPAKHLTFSIMANADRIGRKLVDG